MAEGDTVTVGQVIARISLNGSGPDGGAANGGSASAGSRRRRPPAAPAGSSVRGARRREGLPGGGPRRAVEGVDLATVPGSGPAGRITKSDVLSSARGAGAAGTATAPANGATAIEAAASVTPMKGGAAALARYMEESRAIPTATSFRTLTVTVLEARRRELKEAGQKVSFTHLIAYAIARAVDDMPVMGAHFAEIDGKPHRIDDGQVNLGLAVDVEKRDGSRTLMVPVILDAGRQPFDGFLAAYDALVREGAHEQAHRR